jgi:hypothetical protein
MRTRRHNKSARYLYSFEHWKPAFDYLPEEWFNETSIYRTVRRIGFIPGTFPEEKRMDDSDFSHSWLLTVNKRPAFILNVMDCSSDSVRRYLTHLTPAPDIEESAPGLEFGWMAVLLKLFFKENIFEIQVEVPEILIVENEILKKLGFRSMGLTDGFPVLHQYVYTRVEFHGLLQKGKLSYRYRNHFFSL